MPKRNRSRRTHLQQQLDPLMGAFVDSWMRRSWLLVGPNIAATTELVKESFGHDLESLVHFLTAATDGEVSLDDLFVKDGRTLRLRSYEQLSTSCDVATLIQFPALVGSVERAVDWAKVFMPLPTTAGHNLYSSEYGLRASLAEIRELVDAGVPIEYVRAFSLDAHPDSVGYSRYPVGTVLAAYKGGVAAEFALAVLGR